jgi:hypothetical protein
VPKNRAGGKAMNNQIEIYKTTDKEIQIEVRFEEDSVWLTQM